MGTALGSAECVCDGASLGATVGVIEGVALGSEDFVCVGWALGDEDGLVEGPFESSGVGSTVGEELGGLLAVKDGSDDAVMDGGKLG